MSLSNCARCSRMFQKTGGSRVCFDCREAEEQAYRLVRDFLEGHPGSDIPTVSQGTGVEESMVLRLLQDGRLVTLGELASGLRAPCQRCGGTTSSGRFCVECTEAIGQELKTSAKVLSDQPQAAKLRRPETLQEKRGGHSSFRPDRR